MVLDLGLVKPRRISRMILQFAYNVGLRSLSKRPKYKNSNSFRLGPEHEPQKLLLLCKKKHGSSQSPVTSQTLLNRSKKFEHTIN